MMFDRLKTWWKSLNLEPSKAGHDNPSSTATPAPAAPFETASAAEQPATRAAAHNSTAAQQRFPGNVVAAAPQAAGAAATFAAAKPAASASAAAPARAKLTPEQQREEFFTEVSEANRYSILEVIGKGSYGIVCSAVDNYTGEKVAIKKITNVFEHVSDATRILREIKLLRLLKHPDIVKILHIMLPPNPRDYHDIYVVFELMETDLHQVIKANDDLTPDHHQFFLYQMLRGLKYLHSAKVFHRDLKPKNILANADCKLKICDFGLARPAFENTPTMIFWTDYVATRWYRAPELCGSFFAKYSPAIDIWGVGCIFAEVLLGRPLFPGKNVVNQLELITDLLGTPSAEVVAKVRNEKARRFLLNLPTKQGIPFSQVFPGMDPKGLQLLRALLSFDPADRPTAEQALQHPYFASLHNPAREPTAQPVSKLAFEFDRRKLGTEEVRELIYTEILEYHPAAAASYHSGVHNQRVNFSHPNALDHFKRMFQHLENNPGTVLPPNYQGRGRQGAAAAVSGGTATCTYVPVKNNASATAGTHVRSMAPQSGAGWGVTASDALAAAAERRTHRSDARSSAGSKACQGQPCRGADKAGSSAGAGAEVGAERLLGGNALPAGRFQQGPAAPRYRAGDARARIVGPAVMGPGPTGHIASSTSSTSSAASAVHNRQPGPAGGAEAAGGAGSSTEPGHRVPAQTMAAKAVSSTSNGAVGETHAGPCSGARCTNCRPYSSGSALSTSSKGSVTHNSVVNPATTSNSQGSLGENGSSVQGSVGESGAHCLLQLSPQRSPPAEKLGYTVSGFAVASQLSSPHGRHSLQLSHTQDLYAAPNPPTAAVPIDKPRAPAATRAAATQPDPDSWALGRHSLPGPAWPQDEVLVASLASGVGATGPLSTSLHTAAAAPPALPPPGPSGAGQLGRERAVPVPTLGLAGVGTIHDQGGLVGLGGVLVGEVVLSDREREEASRDGNDDDHRLPPQRIYRAASIS